MKKNIRITVIMIAVLLSICSGFYSCQSNKPGGVGTTVINSDSTITGEIKAVNKQTTGYPWKIDVLVLSSENVSNLPNPTINDIGKTITCYTDEDLSSFRAGQKFNANVKYTGDVPKPGIVLFIYNIKASK
jgi:hypothetical protein